MELFPKNEQSKGEDSKNEEYRKMLDGVNEGLLDIPVGAGEEQLERYRQMQTESIDTLRELMTHPEFADEAIRDLSIMALAIKRDGVVLPGVNDVDYENGARCREILFANKELLFEKALDQKHSSHKWGSMFQIEAIPGYEEELEKYLKNQVEKLGLNLREFEAAWAQAGKEEDQKDHRLYNIFQLLRLDRRLPGSAMELFHRFGIADFARYPLDVLIEQYENRDITDRPYGIMLYPRSDWNGAFYSEEELIAEFHQSLQGSYELRIIECESKWDIGKSLFALDKAYAQAEDGHKIAFAVVCGHGNREVIDFGGKEERHRLHISDLGGTGIGRSTMFFEENPTLVIFSCTTGTEGGVGQELSKAMHATVIAPDGVTSPQSIELNKETGSFDVQYKMYAGTRKYKNGESIE